MPPVWISNIDYRFSMSIPICFVSESVPDLGIIGDVNEIFMGRCHVGVYV